MAPSKQKLLQLALIAPLFLTTPLVAADSDTQALDLNEVCAHLISNWSDAPASITYLATSLEGQVGYSTSRVGSLQSLSADLERLLDIIEKEHERLPQKVQQAWNQQVFSPQDSWLASIGKSLYYAVAAKPAVVVELEAHGQIHQKQMALLNRMQAVATMVRVARDLAAERDPHRTPAGKRSSTEHPDADIEGPIAEWFEYRATESLYALAQPIFLTPSSFTPELESKVETLLGALEVNSRLYVAYLKTTDMVSRHPLRAQFYDYMAKTKVSFLRDWTEREWGVPVSPRLVGEIAKMAFAQGRYVPRRLEDLSWLHQQLKPTWGSDEAAQLGMVRLLQFALNNGESREQAVESLNEMGQAIRVAERNIPRLSLENTVFVLQLSRQNKASAAQTVRLLLDTYAGWIANVRKQAVEMSELDVRTVLMMAWADSFAFDAHKASVFLPQLVKAVREYDLSSDDRAENDAAFLFAEAQSTQMTAKSLLDIVWRLSRRAAEEQAKNHDRALPYSFADWVRIGAMGFKKGLGVESTFALVHTANRLTAHVVPANRLVLAATRVLPKSATVTPVENSALTELLADHLFLPFAAQENVLYSLAPTALGPESEVRLSWPDWNLVGNERPALEPGQPFLAAGGSGFVSDLQTPVWALDLGRPPRQLGVAGPSDAVGLQAQGGFGLTGLTPE